jgi:hypothetical protein
MTDTEFDNAIKMLGQQYPDWVNKAIGDRLDSMVDSLDKMSGTKGTGQEAKARKQNNEELAKGNKIANASNKAKELSIKGMKSLDAATGKYAKSLGKASNETIKVANALTKGDLTGAIDRFSHGLSDSIRTLGKSSIIFGGAAASVLAAGHAANFLVKEMQQTRAAFSVMASRGVFVANGFRGLRQAAIDGELTIDQLSKAVGQNTQAFLALGPTATTTFGKLSLAMRQPTEMAAKLGMNIDELNEFLSDNLELQRVTGMINRLDDNQRKTAAERQLKELTLFSSILGKSRKQIMDEMKSSLRSPITQNLVHILSEQMEDGGAAFKKNLQTLTGQMAGIVKDPEAAKKMTDMAVALFAESKGVDIIDPAMKEFIIRMNQTAPEVVNAIKNSFSSLEDVDETGDNVKNATIGMAEAFQNGTNAMNHSLNRILLTFPEFSPIFADTITQLQNMEYDLAAEAMNAINATFRDIIVTLGSSNEFSTIITDVTDLIASFRGSLETARDHPEGILGGLGFNLSSIFSGFDKLSGFGETVSSILGTEDVNAGSFFAKLLPYAILGLPFGIKGVVAGAAIGSLLSIEPEAFGNPFGNENPETFPPWMQGAISGAILGMAFGPKGAAAGAIDQKWFFLLIQHYIILENILQNKMLKFMDHLPDSNKKI